MNKILKIVPYIAIALLVGVAVSYAGSLTPPGSVANTMYTLTDIFNLSTGTTTTEGTGAIDATPGSISATGKTLTEVYEAIEGEIDNLSAGVIATGTSAFGIDGTLSAGGGLPKTGQTTCWDATGASVACAGTGQDGDYLAGTTRSYTDNGDGTISDEATGLMWKKCSEGQSGATCATGSVTTMNWATALTTCEADTTGGHTDWRLPNAFELFSIQKLDIPLYPVVDSTFFPNTSVVTLYFSSTTGDDLSSLGTQVFVGDFGYGGITNNFSINKSDLRGVRCVR